MLGKIHGKRVKLWRVLAAVLMTGPIPLCISAPLTSPGAQAAPSATSASFDCAKAQSSVESLICKNPELTLLDSSMADAYREAAKRVKPKEVAKLRQEQRRWIQQTRSLCLNATCLKQVYTDRIYILDKTKTPLADIKTCRNPEKTDPYDCDDITVHRNPNDRLSDFSQIIKNGNYPWHSISCTMLINGPYTGTLFNLIFGGYCILQNKLDRLEILIRYDMLEGTATLVSDKNKPKDLNRLVDFINDPFPTMEAQGTIDPP